MLPIIMNFQKKQWLETVTSYALQIEVARGENISKKLISRSALEDTNPSYLEKYVFF